MNFETATLNFDLGNGSVRELNERMHKLSPLTNERRWLISNPRGAHCIAVGLNIPIDIEIDGHVGYYCAGMNRLANITITGNAGVGVAENMVSGIVRVKGDVSQSAGATGLGGTLLVEGSASARCGISMKGIDIIVKGSIGHMSAFMGQAGTLVAFGDAGENLGDSLYEARLYVRGSVASLGSDCIEKPMNEKHKKLLFSKLEAVGIARTVDVSEFRRYGSARQLYHFHVDNAGAY